MRGVQRRLPVSQQFAKIGDSQSPDGQVRGIKWPQIPLGYYVGGTLFAFFSAGICFYWMGFPLVNTMYTYGYTSLNQFNSSRYQWDWYFVWLLTFNIFLPLTFAHALTNNGVGVWGRIHRFFAFIVIWINLLVLGALTFQWIFFCNNSGSGSHSACNDHRWCGVYFAEPGGQCTNGVAFLSPHHVEYANLHRNQEMTTHWIYCFVFTIHAWMHLAVNADFKEYGILK